MSYAFGIDLSKYQCFDDGSKLVDFDAMKRHSEKVSFIFARATVSYGYTDPRYAYYKREAARVGIPLGSYHYCYPAADMKLQMDKFLSVVKPDVHDRLVLDMENHMGLSKKLVTDWLIGALAYLKERTGRYPMIYSRAQWLDTYVDMARLPKGLDYWLAHYLLPVAGQYAKEKPPPPNLPGGVSNWLVHQTGDQTPPLFNVASKVLDYDRWNGDDEEVRAWFGYGEVEPDPEPDTVLFSARVTATAGLRVRSGAGMSFPISAATMLYGTVVDVYEIRYGWYRHNKGGWSDSTWLEIIDDTPPVVVEPYYGALYWQRDPRWKDARLGADGTIGGVGCVMVSETNCLNQLGVVTNPVVNNKWRIENGGYAGNLIVWEKVQEQHPDIIWEGRTYNPTDSQMIAKVSGGSALVILVDHIEASAPLNEHWVCSVNRGDGQLWVHDPWDNQLVRLRDRYKKATPQYTAYRRAVK